MHIQHVDAYLGHLEPVYRSYPYISRDPVRRVHRGNIWTRIHRYYRRLKPVSHAASRFPRGASKYWFAIEIMQRNVAGPPTNLAPGFTASCRDMGIFLLTNSRATDTSDPYQTLQVHLQARARRNATCVHLLDHNSIWVSREWPIASSILQHQLSHWHNEA